MTFMILPKTCMSRKVARWLRHCTLVTSLFDEKVQYYAEQTGLFLNQSWFIPAMTSTNRRFDLMLHFLTDQEPFVWCTWHCHWPDCDQHAAREGPWTTRLRPLQETLPSGRKNQNIWRSAPGHDTGGKFFEMAKWFLTTYFFIFKGTI